MAICTIILNNTDLTGEYEDRDFVVTRGDSRIAMTIARNDDTVQLERKNRFLIDDIRAREKLAYILTKPLKVGAIYNSHGVYSFVLQEVVSTEDDNHRLGIADYYKHFPRKQACANTEDDTLPEHNADNKPADKSREVWL